MALNRCDRKTCGALFSIGAPCCPVCKGKQFREEGSPLPKPKLPKPAAG